MAPLIAYHMDQSKEKMPLKKLIITPYFGPFPEWFAKFEPPVGHDWLLDVNLNGFKDRVRRRLQLDYPGTYGSSKVHDYRCALGHLYAHELEGYDVWVHMDFDMVFGDVQKWFPDDKMRELHIWSNHHSYICGPWTQYRNTARVNTLFMNHPLWEEILSDSTTTGWVEESFSRLVEKSVLSYRYDFQQGDPYHPPFNLKKENGKLFQDGIEIPLLHFRHDKRWPL